MNQTTVYTFIGFVVCVLATVTLTLSSSLDDIEDDAVANLPPSIKYFLSNMRNDGLSLQAPPNVYTQKFKRFMHSQPSKRNGFWIWMPAQGYVSVQNGQGAGGASENTGGGGVLRYGRK